jgi:hypothetical protein
VRRLTVRPSQQRAPRNPKGGWPTRCESGMDEIPPRWSGPSSRSAPSCSPMRRRPLGAVDASQAGAASGQATTGRVSSARTRTGRFWMKSSRTYVFPRLLIAPRVGFPPVERWRGTSPSQAAMSRPRVNIRPSLRTRARLGRHDVPGRGRRKLGELRAGHPLAEDGCPRVIQADEMEPVLPEIYADNRWLRHVPLLLNSWTPFSKRRSRPSITPQR